MHRHLVAPPWEGEAIARRGHIEVEALAQRDKLTRSQTLPRGHTTRGRLLSHHPLQRCGAGTRAHESARGDSGDADHAEDLHCVLRTRLLGYGGLPKTLQGS